MKKRYKGILLICLTAIFMFFIAGCTTREVWLGTSVPGHLKASYKGFNGPDDTTISLKKGQTISIEYESKVTKGHLYIRLLDPKGKSVVEFDENKNGTQEIKAETGGSYTLEVEGKKSSGSFDIKWRVK